MSSGLPLCFILWALYLLIGDRKHMKEMNKKQKAVYVAIVALGTCMFAVGMLDIDIPMPGDLLAKHLSPQVRAFSTLR